MTARIPTSPSKKFADALTSEGSVIAPVAYDALTAVLIERAGFAAAYVGSFATAASAFGLPDVGLLTLDELATSVHRISRATNLPVLADGEAGFFEAANIWRTVETFEHSGAVGIHLEDNRGGKHSTVPAGLLPMDQMAARIRAAADAKKDPHFQIIARTDAAWVFADLDDTVRRLTAYVEAGADAVFAPGITAEQLDAIRSRFDVPFMVLGDLPDRQGESIPSSSLGDYEEAGADLIVLFYWTLGAAALGVRKALEAVRHHGDIRDIQGLVENQVRFEAALGYTAYEERVALYGGGTHA